MLKAIIITAVLLFPWSLVVAVVGAALYRRRVTRALRSVATSGGHPELYIPPSSGGPLLLDSAQIVRSLAKEKQ